MINTSSRPNVKPTFVGHSFTWFTQALPGDALNKLSLYVYHQCVSKETFLHISS